MTSKTASFFIVALVIAFSAWLFGVDKGIEQSKEASLENEQVVTEQTRSQPTTVREAPSTPSAANEVQPKTQLQIQSTTEQRGPASTIPNNSSPSHDNTEALQRQLDEERQKLQTQQENLNNLKNQNEQQSISNTYSQIQEGNIQLRNLAMELRNYDNVEREINRRADELIRDQNSQAQVLRDQLEADIKNLEGQILQTQEQIEYWQLNRNYITEQLVRLAEFQDAFELQRQQLEDLRQQRLNLSNVILENERLVREQKEQELGDLEEDKLNLQNQILSMNEELARLQQEQDRQRTSRMSLASQIIQAQKAFEEQQKKVRILESSLNQKNNETQSIIE